MPGSMDGLKLAHAVHDRWPSIKIILVSGQVKLSDDERPTDSRFFGKPLVQPSGREGLILWLLRLRLEVFLCRSSGRAWPWLR
jgi:hypothetical protein